MNSLQFNQSLDQAKAIYCNVLYMVFIMLRKYGPALALMIPGLPDQLVVDTGVGVTASGQPLFCAMVRRCGNVFRSPMDFGNAVQEALDRTCYQNCFAHLRLLHVDQFPGGYVMLTLTFGG